MSRKPKARKPPELTLVPAIQPPMNFRAIELVEEVLERLRDGESVAVAIVEVRRGRTVATAWADGADGCFHMLNSGAVLLSSRLAQEV